MIETGTLLQDRFLVESRIGEGGMGAVYLAVDQKFGTRVAIKETFYGEAELAEAFEREARLLNGLHHPIFPHVSDHFTENGGHFLVMEYIEGEDMSVLLKRGEVFAVEEVMRWTLDLLDGLDYLHSQDPPVIHRDIKPNNLKLTSRGNIVLLDFGMAKETSGNTLGMKSVFGYSRRYSPLEQIEGTGTDNRSDIFSLGATVFHLLTGKPPVDVLARASAIVSGRPDPLEPANSFRADVPDSVASIISSALALNPNKRFATARAMWSALEYALGLDFADDAASPALEASSTAAVVSAADDFTALDAFKAGAKDKTPDTPGETAGPVVLSEHENQPNTVAGPPDFEEIDPSSAQQVSQLPEGDNEAAASESWNDIVRRVTEHDFGPDNDAPLERAVIHLEPTDLENDPDETPAREYGEGTPETPAIPVVPVANAEPVRLNIDRRLGSTGVFWLTLLLALLSGLVVFGVFGSSSGEPVVQETTAEPAANVDEPISQPGTATGSTEEGPVADTAAASDESAINDVRSAYADREQTNTPNEPAPPDDKHEPAILRSTRERRMAEKVQAENAPESRRSEARSESPKTARRVPQRQTRRRSGAERPRLVDEIGEPPVGTIETVLTGIPYERRRRWQRDWETDEEFRRRRMRQMRRENRRPFPF